jgi:FSR family fosmidomycin resistance protein-like MFS transporter
MFLRPDSYFRQGGERMAKRPGGAKAPAEERTFSAALRPGAGAALPAAHFFVDYGCILLLWRFSGMGAAWGWLLLGYDALAFGLQPLIGARLDRRPDLPLAPAGCALAAAGLALGVFAPGWRWAAMAAAGVGNALFHVGAGAQVLRGANGRLAPLGVFVAAGAPGVALGKLAGGRYGAALAGLVLCTAMLAAQARCGAAKALPRRMRFSAAARAPERAVLALALGGILLRAAGGWTLPAALSGPAAVLVPALCAAGGKALGGFAGDRFGARGTGLAALAGAAVLTALHAPLGPWALPAAVLLFNMTMPLALGAVATVLPDAPGLAFGLPTLALLLGTVPCFFWRPADGTALTVALCIASVFCLAGSSGGSGIRKENDKTGNRTGGRKGMNQKRKKMLRSGAARAKRSLRRAFGADGRAVVCRDVAAGPMIAVIFGIPLLLALAAAALIVAAVRAIRGARRRRLAAEAGAAQIDAQPQALKTVPPSAADPAFGQAAASRPEEAQNPGPEEKQ